MIPASLRKIFGIDRQATRQCWAAHAKLRLALEKLEDKIVLATINVPGDYTTITEAEDNANPGDTIKVAAGDYRGEGVIAVDVPRLEIEGAQEDVDPTQPGRTPAGPNESTVTGFNLLADKIEIEGFTVNNTSGDGITTAPDHSGYEIENNIFSGNQNVAGKFGAGILLRSNGKYQTEIEENWFNNAAADCMYVPYGWAGPVTGLGPNGWDIRNFNSDGPLFNVEIEENLFSEPTQFGSAIDLEGGKDKTAITKVSIEENHFEHSNGIILWGAANSEISENRMINYSGNATSPANGVDISLKFFEKNVEVEDNYLYAGPDSGDGIRVENTFAAVSLSPSIKIEENTITGGDAKDGKNGKAGGFGQDGIHLINTGAGFVIRVEDNEIEHMGHHGINLDGSGGVVTGVLVQDNDITFCAFDGIHLQAANKNTVINNTSHNNGENGILLTDSSDNLVKKNETRRNTTNGIKVGESAPGLSMGNTFNKNKSFDNNTLADPFTYDFRDSTGPGPSNVGTKNTWTGNKGGTANPSAILTS